MLSVILVIFLFRFLLDRQSILFNVNLVMYIYITTTVQIRSFSVQLESIFEYASNFSMLKK